MKLECMRNSEKKNSDKCLGTEFKTPKSKTKSSQPVFKTKYEVCKQNPKTLKELYLTCGKPQISLMEFKSEK